MTRSLGDFYSHRHGISCEPEIVRYVVNQLPADARSAVLVLASDGLWDILSPRESAAMLYEGLLFGRRNSEMAADSAAAAAAEGIRGYRQAPADAAHSPPSAH